MKIKIISFGVKNGMPADVSFLIDCRGIRNPYHDPSLRKLRGTDERVKNKVLSHPRARSIIKYALETIVQHIKEEKQEFTFGVFCTGGHHRSVAITERISELLQQPEQIEDEEMSQIIRGQPLLLTVTHRDINH